MEIRIQAVHFDAKEQLKTFIEKKIKKLTRFSVEILEAEVFLKIVKPEVAHNKNASVRLMIKGKEMFAEKLADTFEEAIDLCCDALKSQLEKYKEKHHTTKGEVVPELLGVDEDDLDDLDLDLD